MGAVGAASHIVLVLLDWSSIATKEGKAKEPVVTEAWERKAKRLSG